MKFEGSMAPFTVMGFSFVTEFHRLRRPVPSLFSENNQSISHWKIELSDTVHMYKSGLVIQTVTAILSLK